MDRRFHIKNLSVIRDRPHCDIRKVDRVRHRSDYLIRSPRWIPASALFLRHGPGPLRRLYSARLNLCDTLRLRAVAPRARNPTVEFRLQSAVVVFLLSIAHCARGGSRRYAERSLFVRTFLRRVARGNDLACQHWHGACLKFTHFSLRGRVSLLLSLRWLAKNSEARTLAFWSAGVSHGHRIPQAKNRAFIERTGMRRRSL